MKITKKDNILVVDIEGVIGIPEEWQFDTPKNKVSTYEKFRANIDDIRNTQANEIIVNIRSTGGDVNDAMLIHEALLECKAKVTTICFGYVASAATVIAQAGSEGCRLISKNALYLIHLGTCSAEGNALDLQDRVNLLKQTDAKLEQLYSKRSGKSAELYRDLMEYDNGDGRWLDANEVITYGLADGIMPTQEAQKHNGFCSKIKQIIGQC